MSDRLCGTETKAGSPCESWVVCNEHGRCYTHDPCRAEERKRSRSRGGHAAAQKDDDADRSAALGETPPPPENLEDAAAWCAWTVHLCATGRLGNTRARSIAKLLDTFRRCVERGDAKADLEEFKERLLEAARGAEPRMEVVE